MKPEDILKVLYEHPETGLIVLGIAILIVWGFGIAKPLTGIALIVVGVFWYAYQAFDARDVYFERHVEVRHYRDETRPDGNLAYRSKDTVIENKWSVRVPVTPPEGGRLMDIKYRCEPGPGCAFVYPCESDQPKCRLAIPGFKDSNPMISTCSGQWNAISNGSDAMLVFTVSYQRRMIATDSEYAAWQAKFPAIWRVINLLPVRQPCS